MSVDPTSAMPLTRKRSGFAAQPWHQPNDVAHRRLQRRRHLLVEHHLPVPQLAREHADGVEGVLSAAAAPAPPAPARIMAAARAV